MNENLNLVEILKDCPKGTKLYSRFLGSVEFCQITTDNYIEVIGSNGYYVGFKPNGTYQHSEENAEIDLFPSKNQRDWNKWQRPFVDGDIIFRKQVIEGFKFHNIGIYKSLNNPKATNNMTLYCQLNADNDLYKAEHDVAYANAWRLATEKEKQKLFKALEDNGYKWNPKTKTLEKLKKEKFDLKTLKPFESKVLVSTFGKWVPAIFGHYNKEHALPIVVVGGNVYAKCIPYEGNEHLIDTFDQPSEFYRYWED